MRGSTGQLFSTMVVRKPAHRFLDKLGVEYNEGSDYKGSETAAGVQGRWRRPAREPDCGCGRLQISARESRKIQNWKERRIDGDTNCRWSVGDM